LKTCQRSAKRVCGERNIRLLRSRALFSSASRAIVAGVRYWAKRPEAHPRNTRRPGHGPSASAHDEAGAGLLDQPARREAAGPVTRPDNAPRSSATRRYNERAGRDRRGHTTGIENDDVVNYCFPARSGSSQLIACWANRPKQDRREWLEGYLGIFYPFKTELLPVQSCILEVEAVRSASAIAAQHFSVISRICWASEIVRQGVRERGDTTSATL
jgi:hypothetical protein